MCNKSQGFYGLDGMFSPAAQAIMVAWESEWSKGSFCHEERSVAAALRAAADRFVLDPEANSAGGQLLSCKDQLLAIAAELEGAE